MCVYVYIWMDGCMHVCVCVLCRAQLQKQSPGYLAVMERLAGAGAGVCTRGRLSVWPMGLSVQCYAWPRVCVLHM